MRKKKFHLWLCAVLMGLVSTIAVSWQMWDLNKNTVVGGVEEEKEAPLPSLMQELHLESANKSSIAQATPTSVPSKEVKDSTDSVASSVIPLEQEQDSPAVVEVEVSSKKEEEIASLPQDLKNESISASDSYQRGIISYDISGNIQEAIKAWEKAAQSGHKASMYNLGVLYFNGEKVKQDLYMALYWFEKAAKNGDTQSQYQTAQIYKKVEQNDKKAFFWLAKAAAAGHAQAQLELAQYYLKGVVVLKNEERGFYWTLQSALSKNIDAQYDLYILYFDGIGVSKDESTAIKWLKIVADKGLPKAQYDLAKAYERGIYLPQDYKKAHYWYNKAAAQQYADAQYELGLLYSHGKGVARDYLQAYRWFERAHKNGKAGAQATMKAMESVLVPRSEEKIKY